jgi:hypothetical protein
VSSELPSEAAPPITSVWTARKNATNSAPTRLPSSTRVRFLTTSPASILPRMALSGTSIMFPVARSEPATRTRTRPRVKAAPMNRVGSVPQVPESSPEETVIATSAPKEM